MKIKELSETIYVLYSNGRVRATNKALDKADILQEVKMALGKLVVAEYYDSRKQDEYLEADYSFYSQLLTRQVFDLSDTTGLGRRSIDMSQFDLYRLPKNKHIVNITPIGDDCAGDMGSITLIAPGEENFYKNDPQMKFLMFAVPVGKGIDTYHVPPCVKKIEVESNFNTDDIDVSLDIAFDIANQILGITLGLPDYLGKASDNSYTPPQKLLRKNMQQSQPSAEV